MMWELFKYLVINFKIVILSGGGGGGAYSNNIIFCVIIGQAYLDLSVRNLESCNWNEHISIKEL